MQHAISPLDGRYGDQMDPLRPYFSEEALMKARTLVEISYFIALSKEPKIKELGKLTDKQIVALWNIVKDFDEKDAHRVKELEKTTKHDVKAVEYFLKEKMGKGLGLGLGKIEFVHFALTSEDVNNLAYGMLIMSALDEVIVPHVKAFIKELKSLAQKNQNVRLLSLTHGQPATPSTLGKELMVFVARLERQLKQFDHFSMSGKLGGAVGNFSAHRSAYPEVNWEKFRTTFVKSLGLDPLSVTTQINPHDDIAELSHLMSRINTILLDFSRDTWLYIMRGVFSQKIVKGEVGSSTMPHKVNPIDFENAEGNLGISTALFTHFAEKLPVSRLQRDLSDSTVQRNIGVAFGHHLLAVHSLLKGLGRITPNRAVITKELDDHPEVHAEAIQTVLRKHGVSGAYEKLKELTRGEKVTTERLRRFIGELSIPKAEKDGLLRLL